MIEIIPTPKEEKEKVSPWLKILLFLSLIIFLGVILAFFLLSNFQKKAELHRQDLERQILALKTEEIKNLERELKETEKTIKDFSDILSKHILISDFFKFLEKNIHPQVFLSKLEIDTLTLKVSFSGLTENFITLNQQIQILEKSGQIKEVNLTTLSLTKEEKIEFSLDISLDQKFFQHKL